MRSLKIFVLLVAIPVVFNYRYAAGQDDIIVSVVPVNDTIDGCGSGRVTLVVQAPTMSRQDSVLGFDIVVGYDSAKMSINSGLKIGTASEGMDEVAFNLAPGEARIAAGNITRFVNGTQLPLVALGGEVFDKCSSEVQLFVKRSFLTVLRDNRVVEIRSEIAAPSSIIVAPEQKIQRQLELNALQTDTIVFDSIGTSQTVSFAIAGGDASENVTNANIQIWFESDIEPFTLESVEFSTTSVSASPVKVTNNLWSVYCSVVQGSLIGTSVDITLLSTIDEDITESMNVEITTTNSCSCVFLEEAFDTVALRNKKRPLVDTHGDSNYKTDFKVVVDGVQISVTSESHTFESMQVYDVLGREIQGKATTQRGIVSSEVPMTLQQFIVVVCTSDGHCEAMNIIR